MGIIRAIKQTVGGTLADQWLEVIEPENMGGQTVQEKEQTEKVGKIPSPTDR